METNERTNERTNEIYEYELERMRREEVQHEKHPADRCVIAQYKNMFRKHFSEKNEMYRFRRRRKCIVCSIQSSPVVFSGEPLRSLRSLVHFLLRL